MEGTAAPEHQSKLGLKAFEEHGPVQYPKMPVVKPHPEALSALVRLGAGQLDSAEAMQHIGYFVHSYLHQYSAAPHGSLVGAMMSRALFPELAEQVPLEALGEQWDKYRDVPFDGVGTEAGVGTFAIACAAASDDPNVEAGSKRLWEEKLKTVLPPPPELEDSGE
jgi:hypothetical protein